ncbi:hypothetical protein GCM10009623_12860 [Nocardioides aestuarii]|uniref:Secreted protein n=1 Tax=Nocardioides aestuarii TaxID=252231 RepID=A0ABW4TIQ3_9ACTN
MISSARTSRFVALAAATVLGLSVATAAPASADSRTIKDGKGDTWNIASETPKKASGHPEGDLRKVTFNHTARKVVITARMQNLKKSGEGVGVYMNIDTPDDTSYGADLIGTPDNWRGEASVYGSASECSPTGSLNYKKDVAKLSIPRSCLGRPDWVRFQLAGAFAKSENKIFYDDATGKKVEFAFTRRVARG